MVLSLYSTEFFSVPLFSAQIKTCTEILCTYLRNILDNPDEEKYRKIRMSNRTFQEKVKDIVGAIEFLQAAGFDREELSIQDRTEEYLVFSLERITDIEYLRVRNILSLD